MRPRGDTHDEPLEAQLLYVRPAPVPIRRLVGFWFALACYLLACAACWYGVVRLVLWVLP